MEELPITPRGIRFQADFVSASHEAKLLHIFRNELEWPVPKKPGARLSLHYGYTFDYKTFGIDPDIPYKPFPEWLVPLIPRLHDEKKRGSGTGTGTGTAIKVRLPDQVCLQYYPPGAGIPPHVDTHSAYDELYALSLGSPVVMQFRRTLTRTRTRTTTRSQSNSGKTHTNSCDDNNKSANNINCADQEQEEGEELEREIVDVDLPPRSMMQMSGESRLHWEHGIKKRKKDVLPDGTVRMRGDRWSITYRWLREGGVCECGDENLCDTAQRRVGVEREYRWKQQQQAGSEGSSGEKQQQDNATQGGKDGKGGERNGLAGSRVDIVDNRDHENIISLTS
jgi:alkylated DNA repair dioxygenase AlkB